MKHSRLRLVISLALVVVLPAGSLLLGWLERTASTPLLLRDRPVALSGVALAGALLAVYLVWPAPRHRRWIAAGAVVAVATAGATGWQIRQRYALPDSSALAAIGEPLPDIVVEDEAGRKVALSTLTGRPTLLIWFRGSWCPYCRRQLSDLVPAMPSYGDRVRVLAVTSESPPPLAALRRELRLPFSLLSDPGGALMRRCESSHCVAILDADGITRWSVVSGNWAKLPPSTLLQRTFEER